MNQGTNSANNHTWSYLVLATLRRTKRCSPKEEKSLLLKVIETQYEKECFDLRNLKIYHTKNTA